MAPRRQESASMAKSNRNQNSPGPSYAKKSESKPLRVVYHTTGIAALIAMVYICTVQGIATICKHPTPVTSCSVPEQQQKKWKFWRRPVKSLMDQESDATSYCQAAWDFLEEYFPPLPWILYPKSRMTIGCPSFEKSSQGRKNVFKKLASKFKLPRKKKVTEEASTNFQSAFTSDWKLTPEQIEYMKTMSVRIRSKLSDVQLADVAWGGPGGPYWWSPPHGNARHHGVDGLDGGRTLASYLRIMKWPEDLMTYFPFKLCNEGCGAEKALEHTVEWRSKYKPWLMTPSALKENKDGFVYFRGHSPSLSRDNTGHSMVWYRVGTHKVVDPEAYFRVVLNTLDSSIADNLKRSHQKIGKYNVVLDGDHFRFSMMPNLNDVKRGIVMMQDHFPDRLGVVFLVNMSKPGEILFNLISPFISKEVREKIRFLPHDEKKRLAILETVVEKEYLPDWLGGTDNYRFDPSSYYPSSHHWTEKEGLEYLHTMPYHA